MTRKTFEVAPAQDRRSAFGRRNAVELRGVQLRSDNHFTRLWPNDSDGLYTLGVLPVRVVALCLLWATSSPGRSAFALAVSGAIAGAGYLLL